MVVLNKIAAVEREDVTQVNTAQAGPKGMSFNRTWVLTMPKHNCISYHLYTLKLLSLAPF